MQIFAILIASIIAPAFAAEPPELFDRQPPMPCVVAYVHDGDTFMAILIESEFIRGGRPYQQTRAEDVRIKGLDTPEMRERGGPKARDAFIGLAGSGVVWVDPTGRHSFTRIEADVYIILPTGFLIDVARAMTFLGHIKGE